ncbi:MAG: hypothetical protein ACI4F0_02455 [Agathobacter sp.]
MGRLSKEAFLKIAREKIEKGHISQCKLGEKLGYTRFAFNKIIKGKQKMYLNEFLELAYELNILSPTLNKSLKSEIIKNLTEKDIEFIFKEHDWSYALYQEHRNKYISEIEKFDIEWDKLNQILSHWEQIKNALNEIDDYMKDTETSSNTYAPFFIYLIEQFNSKMNEYSSSFDAASYAEYLKLKRSAELIENQYVFNLSELSRNDSK